MQHGGSEHDPCRLFLIMDNTSHYSQQWAKVMSQGGKEDSGMFVLLSFFLFLTPSSRIREPPRVVSSSTPDLANMFAA